MAIDFLQYIPILLVGFVLSMGVTPATRQLAMRLGVVDRPSSARKAGARYTPLMGGLAMYIGFTFALWIFSPPQHLFELAMIVGGATILAVVGLLDDRYELSWNTKLGAMVLVALMLVVSDVRINLSRVFIFDVAISVLWLVTLMNAVNFLDNMDGLAAGLTAIASFFFMVIAILQGQVLVSSLAAALCGSTLGFLVYNFNPASTFMGDMGALVLGFIVGILGIKLTFATQPLNVTWMIPLFVLALPLSDICLVVYTRLSEGRSPSEAGKDHTSHRLRSRGLSLIQALFALYAFCGVFGTLALLISLVPPLWGMVLGCVGFAMLFGWFRWMMALRQRYQLESKGNS